MCEQPRVAFRWQTNLSCIKVWTKCTSKFLFLVNCPPGPSGPDGAGLKMANQSAPSFFNSGGTLCGSMLRSTGMGGIETDDPGGGGRVATAMEFEGS